MAPEGGCPFCGGTFFYDERSYLRRAIDDLGQAAFTHFLRKHKLPMPLLATQSHTVEEDRRPTGLRAGPAVSLTAC